MTVLIVDDDTGEVERLRRLFEDAGHRVTTAATGAQALRLAQDEAPYLALIDTQLPDMSGLQVLRQIRLNPQTRGIGVVLANPAATDDEIIFGFRYFSDYHWRRPLGEAELGHLLEQIRREPKDPEPREFRGPWNEIWDTERKAA